MLLALDVGNTNIVIGFLDESGIRNIARLETDRDKTAHEYATLEAVHACHSGAETSIHFSSGQPKFVPMV